MHSVTLTVPDRVRGYVPETSLRRIPLRTKLVAAVLALVFAALTLISAASTYALHSYMIGRLDDGLLRFTETLETLGPNEQIRVPAEYYVYLTTVDGVGSPAQLWYDKSLRSSQ